MDSEFQSHQFSHYLVAVDKDEQSFEHPQYFNQTKTQEQHSQGATQPKTQKLIYKQKDLKYKNLPKLIGNNFLKWIKRQAKKKKVEQIPQGIADLMKSREKCSQPNFTIKDLSSLCNDEPSQKIFQEFIENQLFLDLYHSNKIADPFSYIPGISNYFSAAEEPKKMKSNYLTRNYFTQPPQQN